VVFFDVGQGDAALVEYPGGLNFLVDTGPSYRNYTAAESMVIPSLRNAGIKKLDGVFLTHMDTDHIGGLPAILKNMKVLALYCRISISDSLRKLYGGRVTGLSAGDSISFSGGGILIISSGEYSMVHHNENNASLLMRFSLGSNAIIFTGDIEGDMQHALLPWGRALRAEVLKIPHHGAAGLDSDFVGTIGPKTAIISCGIMNRYGHPAQTTLNVLDRFHCTIHRTDREGSIIFRPPDFPAAAESF
jgi:competence protein ComEC